MYSLLLALIYVAFISLGLPDALLGSAWPAIYPTINVPVSYAGLITMIIAGNTIISSLNANRVISKFGTGLVTVVSVLITAVALFGFASSNSFLMLCLWAIPYGLGAGAVDTALNNFVALHYASRHMNWLHCFWGVGASIGPYVMGYSLVAWDSWQSGYNTVGLFQLLLTITLFFSLPLWKRKEMARISNQIDNTQYLRIRDALKIRGVKQILIAFFGYCALETTTGLWASSWLVLHRGIEVETAAKWSSLFYLGITIGRFLSGFVAERFGNRNMIRIGLSIITIGLVAVLLPLSFTEIALVGLVLVGLGCAPIYPSVIHETPNNFGAENSQGIIGIQMASAYTGSTLMPPFFGLVAKFFSVGLYPFYLCVFLILMLVMTERLNRIVDTKNQGG